MQRKKERDFTVGCDYPVSGYFYVSNDVKTCLPHITLCSSTKNIRFVSLPKPHPLYSNIFACERHSKKIHALHMSKIFSFLNTKYFEYKKYKSTRKNVGQIILKDLKDGKKTKYTRP